MGKLIEASKNLFGKSKKTADQKTSLEEDSKTLTDLQLPIEADVQIEDPSVSTEKNERQLKKAVSDVAVHLWRIRKKMIDERGEPLEETRRHYRHVQAAMDDLMNSEIEIKDFDDQIIPENGVLSIRVLAYQPTPGLSSEKVIETVKPAIYFKGETIQYGEVIVGIPENEGETV